MVKLLQPTPNVQNYTLATKGDNQSTISHQNEREGEKEPTSPFHEETVTEVAPDASHFQHTYFTLGIPQHKSAQCQMILSHCVSGKYSVI